VHAAGRAAELDRCAASGNSNLQLFTMNPWTEIIRLPGHTVPDWVKEAFLGPKLVRVPAGRTLYAAGPPDKTTMRWGAFEEQDADWYQRGNQLDSEWYTRDTDQPVPIYEYSITLTEATPAVMGKVSDQPGAPSQIGPAKFQYYNPAGFGRPIRGRFLGYWNPPN